MKGIQRGGNASEEIVSNKNI